MSDLFNNIIKNAQAFEVYSRVVEVKSNNISHLHDEHYAKQSAYVSSGGNYVAKSGFRSHGIELSDVQSSRSALLDENIIKSIVARGSLDVQQDFAEILQSNFSIDISSLSNLNDVSASGGLADAILQFFNAWESLSANPSDSAFKQEVYDKGSLLADQFNHLDSQFNSINTSIDDKVNDDVTALNNILTSITNSNERIARLEINTTQKALEERDNRQKLLEELAQYTNFTVKNTASTSVPGGIQIVVKDTSNNDVVMVDHNRVANTFAYDGTKITTGGGSPVDLQITGGHLHGYLDFRANTLSGISTDLDNLASQMTTSVNLAYNPTFVTGDFFHPAGSTAAAFALHPTLTVANLKSTDTVEAGANELARAVAELAKKSFSTPGDSIDGTFSQAYGRAISSLGQTINTIDQKHNIEASNEQTLMSDRNSRSGVSIDEEVADLLVLQKSIQANAKLIKINSDLLDTLVNVI